MNKSKVLELYKYVKCRKHVAGAVKSTTGSTTCGHVSGAVHTTTGDIRHRHLSELIRSVADVYPNFNVLLNRSMAFTYQEVGREQTKEQAVAIDKDIASFLTLHGIPHEVHCSSDYNLTGMLIQTVLGN